MEIKNIKMNIEKSSVGGPFGIFKEQFQIEKEVCIGMIKQKKE